jgi:hypothetical protein
MHLGEFGLADMEWVGRGLCFSDSSNVLQNRMGRRRRCLSEESGPTGSCHFFFCLLYY